MKIQSIHIQNFRSILDQTFNLNDLSILIGNNGTGKTSILEAINFCLSPYSINGRIKHTDFYNGVDTPITIELVFNETFSIDIQDGYNTQSISCNKIHLDIKKREKATPNKSFSDGFVTNHYAVPVQEKATDRGWSIKRKNNSSFDFTERHLSLSNVQSNDLPRCFYFNRNREQQIKKGYNSSITQVFDDFNWRFTKELRKASNNSTTIITDKYKLEKSIFELIDDSAIEKSFLALNDKLKSFGLDDVRLSLMDGNAPFDSAFLSNTIGSLDMAVSNLGSGIEMIISLLFLETLASLSKENILILIDEPELHLHPQLQEILINYLISLSPNKQIVISTHSPYFFKNCNSHCNISLIITTKSEYSCLISNAELFLANFPWSPSWGEINYYAYNLPLIEFHNELYGYLQSKNNVYRIDELDNYLFTLGIPKSKKWIKETKDGKDVIENVTIMTYIRHMIHHSENKKNDNYSPDEFSYSIKTMLSALNL
jgi:predicted ATP-dependent endonuclease of OLD family